jgi:hypothetical protein
VSSMEYLDSERGRLMSDLSLTIPPEWEDIPPPRRQPKGMLPSTWLKRECSIEYERGGEPVVTRGTLLEAYPVGCIVSAAGEKMLVSWDALVSLTLLGE